MPARAPATWRLRLRGSIRPHLPHRRPLQASHPAPQTHRQQEAADAARGAGPAASSTHGGFPLRFREALHRLVPPPGRRETPKQRGRAVWESPDSAAPSTAPGRPYRLQTPTAQRLGVRAAATMRAQIRIINGQLMPSTVTAFLPILTPPPQQACRHEEQRQGSIRVMPSHGGGAPQGHTRSLRVPCPLHIVVLPTRPQSALPANLLHLLAGFEAHALRPRHESVDLCSQVVHLRRQSVNP